MMFSKYGQAVLAARERTCRLLGIRPVSNLARTVARNLVRLFAKSDRYLTTAPSFAHRLALHSLTIETFFCNPHAPGKRAVSRMLSGECVPSCHESSTLKLLGRRYRPPTPRR